MDFEITVGLVVFNVPDFSLIDLTATASVDFLLGADLAKIALPSVFPTATVAVGGIGVGLSFTTAPGFFGAIATLSLFVTVFFWSGFARMLISESL